MRKLLLATTALFGGVAFAGAVHATPAQTSPITLNVGGYVDFVAGFYNGSQGAANAAHATPAGGIRTSSHDFETEFKINFDALGKASNGMQYGANVSLWNGADVTNQANTAAATSTATPFSGGKNQVTVDSAYVWLSGAFGKALFGDERGASDLFVYAPTVGEGQVDGRYTDFVDPTVLARIQPSGIDNTEHSTKITYYTPKVGNDDNKVQLGVSYIPNLYDYGQNTVLYNQGGVGLQGQANSPYQDVIKAAVEYTGNFHPVNLAVSGQIITGDSSHAVANTTMLNQNLPAAASAGIKAQDFTAWGVGTQIGFSGFTVGGSYVNEGRYNTIHGQNHNQDVTTLGAKYEFDKVAVGASWLTGQGYDNLLVTNTAATTPGGLDNDNYVSSFNAYGLGAAYTWFPGLTTNLDGVWYSQKNRGLVGTTGATGANANSHNDGYVLLLSEKMTF